LIDFSCPPAANCTVNLIPKGNLARISGVEIQAAARAQDLDTLMDVSNEKMYPPCEECHHQFLSGAQ